VQIANGLPVMTWNERQGALGALVNSVRP